MVGNDQYYFKIRSIKFQTTCLYKEAKSIQIDVFYKYVCRYITRVGSIVRPATSVICQLTFTHDV